MDKLACWTCEFLDCENFRCEPPMGDCPLDADKRIEGDDD